MTSEKHLSKTKYSPDSFFDVCPKDKVDYLYSVYDVARKAYTAPFLSISHLLAKRFCVDQIKVCPTSYFALYPTSFKLYCIGEFDHNTGFVSSFDPVLLGDFSEILIEVSKEMESVNNA